MDQFLMIGVSFFLQDWLKVTMTQRRKKWNFSCTISCVFVYKITILNFIINQC